MSNNIQSVKVTYTSPKLHIKNEQIFNPHEDDALAWVLECESEEEASNEISALLQDDAIEWAQGYSYLYKDSMDEETEIEEELASVVVEFISHEDFERLEESGIYVLTI